jgi:hypothetical protein
VVTRPKSETIDGEFERIGAGAPDTATDYLHDPALLVIDNLPHRLQNRGRFVSSCLDSFAGARHPKIITNTAGTL